MKIKDIHIDGFGVWTGLSVDGLPETMTLFYGPNEAGKTTLMQSIRAMLYGFTPARREKYLPPVHGGTPGGTMRITGPGGGYEIRRHSSVGDDNVVGQLTVTSADGLTQGHHRLQSLLGQIDESIFTNVFAIGMRELQELSTLDDTSAADELYKLSSGLDRVSLVDVLRNLKTRRTELLGPDRPNHYGGDPDKLRSMVEQRDKLAGEISRLIQASRQWSELANQRRSGHQEIEQLTGRIKAWQTESRTVEIAAAILQPWQKREQLRGEVHRIESQVQLPDEAPGQLVQIDATIEEHTAKLEEVKNRRRAIREKASTLPVSRRMMDLAGRIEAAGQQATWVEAIEQQIEGLDDQIEKARNGLDSLAAEMGLDEDDRLAIIDGNSSELPDLSRQTLSVLSGPAKAVKEQQFLLKQAREESATHRERGQSLVGQIKDVLRRAGSDDLQAAIRQNNDQIVAIRKRIHLGEHLDQIKKQHKSLERESVELSTDEALPVDRALLWTAPVLGGGYCLVYGLANVFDGSWLVSKPDPMWGMFLIMGGLVCMLLYYFGRESDKRGLSVEKEDCERRIASLRAEIREIETERESVDAALPTGIESLEARLRQCEKLVADLEAELPTYHNHQAAVQAYQNARDRATAAAERMRAAKKRWSAALKSIGLSETMSPSSVRKLSDGYERLRAGKKRIDDLQRERKERQKERGVIASRIDALYEESIEVQAEMAAADASVESVHHDVAPEHDEREDRGRQRRREAVQNDPAKAKAKRRLGPLQQLQHLSDEVSRQQHWIKRRRELKHQDAELKRVQGNHAAAIQRGDSQRRALWAKCGVATQQQFHEMVDLKAQLFQLNEQLEQLDNQIRSAIGNVSVEEVAQQIEGATEVDLQKRLESLLTRVVETEDRIAALRTAGGELTSQMKHLADDDRLAVARFDLGCLDRKIDREVRRWQTLGTATCLMEEVCQTFENQRQPETLREASSYLNQLTDGKYTRVWTPLGRNQLRIDDAAGESLPLEVLSRGTREAVFIALRLSLASAYARRGVMLPLVLDDVLVNFDGDRAYHAARTLKTFAQLGHQVMMFTCHRHIVDIFHGIDVEVRRMPAQGTPGRALVMMPEIIEPEIIEPEIIEAEPEYEAEESMEDQIEEQLEEVQEIIEEVQTELADAPEPEVIAEPEPVVAPEPIVIVKEVPAEPRVVYVERPKKKRRKPAAQPKVVTYEEVEEIDEIQTEPSPGKPDVGWAWYQDDMSDEKETPAEAVPTGGDNAWWS